MIRDNVPIFIEFNINNGFFVADHTIEECEFMVKFYTNQFNSRLLKQFVHFDPYGEAKEGEWEIIWKKKNTASKARARSKSRAKKNE